jgi:hypothetical protein
VFTAWSFKYGPINLSNPSTPYNQSNQRLELETEASSRKPNKSINSIGCKLGSGQVIDFTLGVRGGDWQRQSGPGGRARADARRNFKPKSLDYYKNKNFKSGSSIIPGASGYTPQHIYRICIYKESGRLQAPLSEIEAGVPKFNDGVPPRIAPSVSPNRQGRIKSQPLRIKSEHQKTDVIITKKDVKKWITPEQRKETTNQKINEQKVEDKFVDTVKNPNEVLDGIHIHREQKNFIIEHNSFLYLNYI